MEGQRSLSVFILLLSLIDISICQYGFGSIFRDSNTKSGNVDFFLLFYVSWRYAVVVF